jgi:diguanylate cyclase (GGDEF)-like protein
MATRGLPSLGIYNLQFFHTYVNKDPHITKGYELLVNFQFKEALDELDIVIKTCHDNPLLLSEAHTFSGYCYLNIYSKEKSGLAIRHLTKAIALNPKNELAYFFLANEYFIEGNMEKVKECLIEAIRLHPKFIAALRMLAETYKDEGKGQLAVTYYKKIVDLIPSSGYYRFQLYRVYFQQGQYKEAEEQLRKLIEVEPNFTLNYSRLGEVYLKQKKYDKALAVFSKLTTIDNDSYLGFLGRAQVYLAMGKLRDARREIKEAYKNSSNSKEVRDVLNEINTVERENRTKFLYSSLTFSVIIILFAASSFSIYSAHRRKYILSVISSFNEHIDQIYEMGELAVFLLEFFSKVFSIETGMLLLHNRQNNTLSVLISRGLGEKEHDPFQIVTGNEVSNWLMRESKSVMTIKDLERSKLFDESFPSLVERLKKKRMTYLIPLKEKNSCIGFIVLGSSSERDSIVFKHDLLMPLSTLAAQSMQTLFLFESSIVDELTGLYNKRYFFQSIALELKRADRYKQPCSLCTFDIDDFKKLNDTYGHTQGDTILKELGILVKHNIREGIDVATRTGGEEFNLILPATNNELAFTVAERIRTAVYDHSFRGFDRPVKVSISLGIATYPDHAQSESELISNADKALYLAKRTGKNRVKKADEVEKGKQKKTFKAEPVLENRFDHLNIKDEKTGLYNFSYFSLRIKEETKRSDRYKFPCSLVLIRFNASLKDDSSEQALQQIAVIIKSNLREGIDTPTTISDDTLGIILPETARENAMFLAERLHQLIDKKNLQIEGDKRLTSAIGISSYPLCAGSASELVESATKAAQKAEKMQECACFAPPLSQEND